MVYNVLMEYCNKENLRLQLVLCPKDFHFYVPYDILTTYISLTIFNVFAAKSETFVSFMNIQYYILGKSFHIITLTNIIRLVFFLENARDMFIVKKLCFQACNKYWKYKIGNKLLQTHKSVLSLVRWTKNHINNQIKINR